MWLERLALLPWRNKSCAREQAYRAYRETGTLAA